METLRRTNLPRRFSLIIHLQRTVVAGNTALREAVKDMDVIRLLRNVHPYFRTRFAYSCKEGGLIHESELKEFINP